MSPDTSKQVNSISFLQLPLIFRVFPETAVPWCGCLGGTGVVKSMVPASVGSRQR